MSEPTCRVCGCTDDHACNPPCAWFDPTLCTTCALAAEALGAWASASVKPSLAALWHEADIDRRGIDTSDAKLVSMIADEAKLRTMIAEMLNERAGFIAQHAADIAISVQLDGRGQTRYLAELPPVDALREGFRLLLRAEIPQ